MRKERIESVNERSLAMENRAPPRSFVASTSHCGHTIGSAPMRRKCYSTFSIRTVYQYQKCRSMRAFTSMDLDQCALSLLAVLVAVLWPRGQANRFFELHLNLPCFPVLYHSHDLTRDSGQCSRRYHGSYRYQWYRHQVPYAYSYSSSESTIDS